jgi:hypothetical protein
VKQRRSGNVSFQPITDVGFGSRAAVAGRLMVRPVYPQLRKSPSVPGLTFRAKGRHR